MNFLNYQNNKHLKTIKNEIHLLQSIFKEDLLTINFSSFRTPYFIIAKKEGLKRLARTKILCIDKTFFEGKNGFYVLSEKVSYNLGQKCISWLYVVTKESDALTLKEIFLFIKLHVELYSSISDWNPEYIMIDFDQDMNFLIFFSLSN
jgi:hypothetical protein